MDINFNNGKRKSKNYTSKLNMSNFEDMQKQRKKALPEIQETIQHALKDYNGESITIIIQREDENGMPDHTEMVMAGVSRLECQIAMSKTLNKSAEKALEVIMDSAKGDAKAMLQIAAALVDMMQEEK